ncbi:MAG: ATP:cob(I)alamin adenosyltransferase [Thermoanaerobaculia bacterium]
MCRRAERRVVSLHDDATRGTVVYLNRLSDFLFVAARYANFKHGVADVPWRSR